MAQRGGIIPNDGRNPTVPLPGKRAKRHDLERTVPYLHDSDLQQGDVAALERGQKIGGVPSNKRVQPPAAPAPRGGGSPSSTPPAPMQVPDPIQFAKQRFGGQVPDPGVPMRDLDLASWTPLVQRVANQPGSSGMLKQAFIRQFHNLANRPIVPDLRFVDLYDMDEQVSSMLDYAE